jgi:hypothetical protein
MKKMKLTHTPFSFPHLSNLGATAHMPKLTFAKSRADADYSTVRKQYLRAQTGRQKERLLMVLLSLEGERAPKIAQIVKRSVATVRYWLNRWNLLGFCGLEDNKHTGRPLRLTQPQQHQLIDWVIEQVDSKGRITCRRTCPQWYIVDEFARDCPLGQNHVSSPNSPGIDSSPVAQS